MTRPAYQELIATRLGDRYHVDWLDHGNHHRRLITEFIGTFGLVGVLSFGAAILKGFGQPEIGGVTLVILLSLVSSLWLVGIIYAFGDVSAHFNPAMTFAFALRGDMSWRRAAVYWVVQCTAAILAASLARYVFGTDSGLASVIPPPDRTVASAVFEAFLTGGFVLMILAIARGPKLNGPFTPLAVGAYIMSLGTVGGLFEGAAMNPARALGPDLVVGRPDVVWVYVLGSLGGAAVAVAIDRFLRGPADIAEASIAESTPVANAAVPPTIR